MAVMVVVGLVLVSEAVGLVSVVVEWAAVE
jgi:hypothetical protein